jgi:formylglycine-generating enzyme required for sulfatase activity
MYQVGSLIWSAVAPEAMNYEVALQYCKNLGEGARLPSLEEWKALARSLGKGVAGKKYDYKLLPDLNREFWSSTPQKDDLQSAYLFNGNFGAQGFDSREFELAVRCVMNAGL